MKRLYKHFVKFQCKAEARICDILAQKMGSSKKLILYAVQRGPIVHARSEIAVDFRNVTNSNVIGEIGTWDLDRQKNSDRNKWAKQQKSQPYFFALQQGDDNTDREDDKDHITQRTRRLPSIISTCLDPSGAEDPWQNSFAFWNRWRANSDPGDPEITVAQQRAYLEALGDALD